MSAPTVQDVLARVRKAVETSDWLELKPDEATLLAVEIDRLQSLTSTTGDCGAVVSDLESKS